MRNGDAKAHNRSFPKKTSLDLVQSFTFVLAQTHYLCTECKPPYRSGLYRGGKSGQHRGTALPNGKVQREREQTVPQKTNYPNRFIGTGKGEKVG